MCLSVWTLARRGDSSRYNFTPESEESGVIPVTRFKSKGYMDDYINPRNLLKAEEEREVKRVLRKLTADVAKVAKPLSYAIEIMARLDLVTAKARYALDYRRYPPDVNTEGRLWLRQARHPLLEHLFRSETGDSRREVVPIDVGDRDTRG